MVLAITVLVPLVAVAVSLSQKHLYSATSQVVVSRENLANTLTNTPNPAVEAPDFTQIVTTDAQVAHTAPVARMALASAGIHDRSVAELLDNSTATPSQTSDLIQFTVTDSNRDYAISLASSYATSYASYNTTLDNAAITQASRELATRIDQLRRSGSSQSSLLQSLLSKQQQLATLGALQSSGVQVVSSPSSATLVQPRTVRNALIGLILGLVLGLVLAYVRQAFDTRVHSMEEVSASLNVPLLARIPSPTAEAGAEPFAAGLFSRPSEPHAEAFRTLRTAIEFAHIGGGPTQVLAITSAIEGEGKSTTVANLAIAEARAGRHVIAVDLDLRRPTLHRFFEVRQQPGLTDLLIEMSRDPTRAADPSDGSPAGPSPSEAPHPSSALDPVPSEERPSEGGAARVATRRRAIGTEAAATNGDMTQSFEDEIDARLIDVPDRGGQAHEFRGTLRLLPAGTLPFNPVELLGTAQVGRIIDALRDRADVVLIDTPPLLGIGDALAVSKHIDAILLVVRLELMQRQMLSEVSRLLKSSPAVSLGCVLTGAELDEQYAYYASGYYGGDRADRD